MNSRHAGLRVWLGAAALAFAQRGWGAPPAIGDVFVMTSVRHRSITVEVTLTGVEAAGRALMTGQVTDAAGAIVLALQAEATVSATPSQMVRMDAGWRDAKRWEPGSPVRYRVSVRAAGDGWTASRDERFGFREFGVRGREFVLNGRPVRLRALAPGDLPEFTSGDVRRAAAAGFNAIVFTRSGPGDDVLDAADESGILVVARPAPEGRARSNASLVMRLTGDSGTRLAASAHPARIGRMPNVVPESGRRGVAASRLTDPTRPVASFDAGADAQAVRLDLPGIPVQEREEWFSAWGHDGDRPVLAIVPSDPDAAVTRRILRTWRLAGPVSVALEAAPEGWPAAPPALDGWLAGPADDLPSRDHLFHTGETVRKTVVVLNDGAVEVPYSMKWTAEIGGRLIIGGGHGETIPAGSLQTFAAEGALPGEVFGFPSGRMTARVTIGGTVLEETFPFRVFPRPVPGPAGLEAAVLDPEGATTAWLKALGWKLKPWNGGPGRILVVGRKALDRRAAPGSIAAFVAAGGRALVMAQSPQRFRKAGWTVAPAVERRMWPVAERSTLPLLAAVDGEMLRDWRGFGTLVPDTTLAESDPAAWHWGNRGSVCSVALVKPAESGWTALIEGGPDRSGAGLLELRHGRGLAILCTLDLEGRVGVEPAVNHLATRLMDHLRTAPVLAKPVAASTADRRLLDFGAGGKSPRR